MADSRGLDRRQFLQRGLATTVGIGAHALGGLEALAAETEPEIRRYDVLGQTGLKVPDISFGTGATKDVDLVRYAYDRGITYFDTAESYPLDKPGRAERAIGAALQGKRDQVIIATKTEAGANVRRNVLMRRLHRSLKRLQTDYIDVYFNHAVNDVARLRNAEWFEFAELAKRQGKIRFTGMSGHGGNLIECLNIAVDESLFDVFLAAYNFGQDPAFYEKLTRNFDIVANQKGLPEVLARAHAKGIGVLVMKTLMGARLNDMRPFEWPGSTFSQAAFRWVLSNGDVDGLVVSMRSREQIDEFVAASGKGAVRKSDLRLLERYALLQGASYCRHGCNACEQSCPHEVPIAEVLRTRMYATDYADPQMARASYAKLGAGASACLSCAHQSCTGSCPYGLDVPGLTRSTPAILASATSPASQTPRERPHRLPRPQSASS
jgi:predicted aldo/keto reductase-like oxidoreductase